LCLRDGFRGLEQGGARGSEEQLAQVGRPFREFPRDGIQQIEGAPGVAAAHGRDPQGLCRRHPMGSLEMSGQEFHCQMWEIHAGAARRDGGGEQMWLMRAQKEMRVGRRFLEALQESVGRRAIHAMRIADDDDAAGSLERARAGEAPDRANMSGMRRVFRADGNLRARRLRHGAQGFLCLRVEELAIAVDTQRRLDGEDVEEIRMGEPVELGRGAAFGRVQQQPRQTQGGCLFPAALGAIQQHAVGHPIRGDPFAHLAQEGALGQGVQALGHIDSSVSLENAAVDQGRISTIAQRRGRGKPLPSGPLARASPWD
jgi:hypothetical protein